MRLSKPLSALSSVHGVSYLVQYANLRCWYFTGHLVCGSRLFMNADKSICVKENVRPSLPEPGVGVTPSEGPPVRPGGPLLF